MEALQGSDNAAVIADDEFMRVFTTFSQNHMGTGGKVLDTAMTTMLAEMTPMKGATRAQVMRYLEKEPALSHRQAAGSSAESPAQPPR